MTSQPEQPRPVSGTAPLGGEPAPGVCEPWRAFAEWAVRQLGAELRETGNGFRVQQRPPEDATAPAKTESGYWSIAMLARRKRGSADQAAGLDFTAPGKHELVDRLIVEVAGLDDRPALAPADQPTATHEITGRLFNAYQVDGGKMHLGGCRLTPTRFVRWSEAEVDGGELVVRHTFASDAGDPLTAELVDTLGLAGGLIDTDPRSAGGPRGVAAGESATGGERAVTATVVALRAVGALEATINANSVSIPFDGWARTLQPPPAVCPESGMESYHLLAVGDGRIAAAEATGVCDETGRRLLVRDLQTCSVTGRRLDAQLCVTCPVTDEPVAKEALAGCPKCGQQVSRAIVSPGGCAACRVMKKVPRDSPRRGELLRSAPALANWRGWRMAETATVRIVEASTLWRRIIVVFDFDDGQPIYTATRPRLGGSWSPSPLSDLQLEGIQI